MNARQSQFLNIGVIGIQDRAFNALELYFSRQNKGRYVLTSTDSAQVMVADLDAVKGRQLLDEYMASHPGHPVVAFTVRDVEIDGVHLLRKPIQLDELGKALGLLHSEIIDAAKKEEQSLKEQKIQDKEQKLKVEEEVSIEEIPEAVPVSPVAVNEGVELAQETKHSPATVDDTEVIQEQLEASGMEKFDATMEIAVGQNENRQPLDAVDDTEVSQEQLEVPGMEKVGIAVKVTGERKEAHLAPNVIESDQRLARDCCSGGDDIDLTDKEAIKRLFYNPNDYLQGSFQKAVRLSKHRNKAVKLDMGRGKAMFILPTADSVILDVSDRLLRPLCVQSTNTGQHFSAAELDETEESLLARKKGQPCSEIEPLLWKVTLWSSRGRVPFDTNLKGTVVLTNWPNFTRLIAIPQFIRMAAYWSQGEHSLFETTASLGIPQRYMLSFYSACHALNLASISAKTDAGGDKVKTQATDNREHRSMFSKMLSHLRGVNSPEG